MSTIIGAIIGGCFVVIAAIITVKLKGKNDKPGTNKITIGGGVEKSGIEQTGGGNKTIEVKEDFNNSTATQGD